MNLEDELSRLLSDSTSGLATPVHTIIAEATRRGRVLKRRRQIRTAAAALVLSVLVGGVTGLEFPRTPARAQNPPLTVAAQSPEPSATAPVVTADSLFGLLTAWLPRKIKITDYQPATLTTEFETQFGFQVTIDDGDGQATVKLQLSSSNGAGDDPLTCVTQSDHFRRPAADPVGCEQTALPDGSTVRQTVTGADPFVSMYAYDLATRYPDGITLEILVYNGLMKLPSPGDPGPTRTRERPPYGVGFWKDIVANDKWDLPLAKP
jgi:hypothetical protein